ILAIVLLLVAIRLALPYFLTKYLNRVLAKNIIPYRGHIEDIDLHLYRGAYVICDLRVDSVDLYGKRPFLHAPRIDLSIEWKALWKGNIVGEIIMEQPLVNFKLSKKGSQTGANVDWVKLAQDFMPVEINRFAMENGKVNFTYADGVSPDFDMDFQRLQLEVTNIRNVEEKDKPLPSDIAATADAAGYGGKFTFKGQANLLKTMPDFDYNAKLEKAKLVNFNEVFRYYTGGMDFESGEVSLFSEMAMKDGRYVGYFKPILHDAKIFKWKEPGRGFRNDIKELVTEGIQEVFENHPKDQSASRVAIEGTIQGGTPDIWKAIVAAFVNAYIRVFRHEFDNTINFNQLSKNRQKQEGDDDDDDKEGKKKKEKSS
ncbi:MAG: DUF748 domain-containing protein, partial [Bacteroidota bacterium]